MHINWKAKHDQTESDAVTSVVPPAERSAQDQPFSFWPQCNPQVRVDLTPGTFPKNSSQIKDFKALKRKAAGAVSSAIILSEYLFDWKELLDESS